MNTKYIPNFFAYYDHAGIVRHLERMAAKGWMLVHTGSYLWRFRRAEPCAVRFAAIYTKGSSSIFEPDANEALEELREMCAGTGWEWVASYGRMQIFCNTEPDPVPLETDAAVQVAHIHQVMKRRYLPENIIILAVSLLLGALCLWLSASVGKTVLVLGWLCVMLFAIEALAIATYLNWHRKAVRAAEGGVLLPTRSHPWVHGAVTGLMLALVLVWLLNNDSIVENLRFLCNLGIIFLLRWLAGWMRRENVSPGTNRAVILSVAIFYCFGVTFALQAVSTQIEQEQYREGTRIVEIDSVGYYLYQDEVPLKLEDLIEVDPEIQSYFRMDEDRILYETVFAHQSQAGAANGSPWLSYTVCLVRFAPAYDLALSNALDDSFQPLDPEVWGVTAYQKYADGYPSNTFILCLENRIIAISFYLGNSQSSISPTPEQIATILEKLGQFTA